MLRGGAPPPLRERCGWGKAAATADRLEEAAALMQAIEDSTGDDLGRIGEQL